MKDDETPKPTMVNHHNDPGSLLNNQDAMESKAVFFHYSTVLSGWIYIYGGSTNGNPLPNGKPPP